jgi:cardiolipin synthase
VVDDVWGLIGSANLDPRSFRLNFEFNLEIYDPAFAGEMACHIDEAIQASREESMESVDGRPLMEKLRDCTAKLFSPYL